MKKCLLLMLGTTLAVMTASAQLLTWTPDFPKDNDNITITLDASKGNQGLFNYADPNNVYVHIGVTTNLSNSGGQQWLYVNGSTGGAYGGTTPALKATSLGNNKYSYTINNIRAFFGVPAGETIKSIGILFRDANANTSLVKKAANTDGSDMFIPIYDNTLGIRITDPFFQPTFIRIPEPITKLTGDNITLTAIANKPSTMKLTLNGTVIQTLTNVTSITASPVLSVSGTNTVIAEANDGSVTKTETFQFFVAPGVTIAPLPAGVKDGINYASNNTDVTLVLYAPGKTRVSVIGEFNGNNWAEQPQYQMNKTPDGNYWWKTITGLTPGIEYAFQYLVDGTLKVSDPYAEKILDPNNDAAISASTYPGLKPYPTGLTTGIVSLFQTASPGYNWTVNSFNRPDKKGLIIYELLVRDFLAAHDWKTLRDTLNYLQALGINAIELMPFNEFENNNSWGYNPDFYFAPDKYYGPKNTLKEFIDTCHRRGIAVIMDIALNHATGLCPLAALYWNSATNQPAANNPWFNVTAKHPFNVFNDFNHESLATRYFFSRVTENWLQQYKLDGFRFDLSKGFTQTNSGNDVALWSQYDASRVAIWKRYYDTLQLKSLGSYAILEHFAANTEEKELSDYGMMLWGNHNKNFSQASMGYSTPDPEGNTWNFEGILFSVRNWTQPALVGYMESHDEERLMYKNITFGNTSGSYSTKDTTTALKRVEMSAGFLLTVPGPKMIWQFGELGYDYSITSCHPGNTIPTPYPSDQCRVDMKPIRWDYFQEARRKKLYTTYSNLNKLRFNPLYKDIFTNVTAGQIDRNMGSAVKWMKLTTDTSKLLIVGNFDVVPQTATITFQTAGKWYDYLGTDSLTATGAAQQLNLQPGEYHIYLNRNLHPAAVVVVPPVVNPTVPNDLQAIVYPNPLQLSSILDLSVPETGNVQAALWSMTGQKVKTIFSGVLTKGQHQIQLSEKINNLPAGIYFIKTQQNNMTVTIKLVRL